MQGRRAQASLRRQARAGPRATLAIYHVSKDIEPHVAALRRSGRFRLKCVSQRSSSRVPAGKYDGVLWELVADRVPDRRRLSAVARGTPVVSFAIHGGRETADLSQSVGFTSHLKVPLRPGVVARELRLVTPRRDLAVRLAAQDEVLRQRFRRADVLADLVWATLVPVEPELVSDAVVSRMARWLPIPIWAVVGRDQEGRPGLLGERLVTDEIAQVVQAIGLWVLARARPFASANVSADRRVEGEAGAAVGFPLHARGQTVGALVGMDRAPSAGEPRMAARTLDAFAALLEPAALALDNALRMQRAEALSVTDDLTQLYNSRYLSQVLRRETKRATRGGRPLSLLFIDLDGFKSVNDLHGHLCGSRALVEVAAVIKASARETDVVARFGGDEFALVLPETGSEGAVAVGERIRERIAEHQFLAVEGLDVRLTASVGVATQPDVATTADGLMRAADRAMYWIKEHGKNGISVFTS